MLDSQPALRRSLDRLRRGGRPLDLDKVARDLLALRGPLDPTLARRVVATALGCEPGAVPDRFEAGQLRPAPEAALADEPLASARFNVVDLETTGLSPQRSAILEVAAVRVVGLRRTERFASFVRPPGPIPPAISALTGIRDVHVDDAPDPRTVLRGFRGWLERAGPACFVAHNARFDAGFVARGLARHRLAAHRAPVLCTQRLARRLLPRLGRYDLDHLCAHFGITNPARHRATGDAESTARALIELLEIARGQDVTTVGALLDLQSRPTRRKRRRRSTR